jgi:hypothetical protein
MKQLSGMRKADSRLGDDTTFTRWILTGKKGHQHSPRLPGLELGFAREGRTKFPTRVLAPDSRNLLVSGHSNIKIGRDVRQGKLRGYWIYTLSLEERKTCPRACHHWESCYGNNMPFAKRVDHTHPSFLDELSANLDRLLAIRGRPGILVRLHALGDFYSEAYVGFWRSMLLKHPRLAIFGYTAWTPDTVIGRAVDRLIDTAPGRAMIRFSNGGLASRSTVPIVDEVDCPPGAFVCPEQTGQFDACGKCGACWSTLKNVAFMAH